MKFNKFGIAKSGCSVGDHEDVEEKTCSNEGCPYPTHKYCWRCRKFIGTQVDGVFID